MGKSTRARPSWRGSGDGEALAMASVAREQLKAFLVRMQDDSALKQQVLAAATADDVAQIALKLGFEFSGDDLLRASGQRFDRVTVRKNDIPGEYN
jgi:predicted ribosomally synthesized peptide with nif11-like leader